MVNNGQKNNRKETPSHQDADVASKDTAHPRRSYEQELQSNVAPEPPLPKKQKTVSHEVHNGKPSSTKQTPISIGAPETIVCNTSTTQLHSQSNFSLQGPTQRRRLDADHTRNDPSNNLWLERELQSSRLKSEYYQKLLHALIGESDIPENSSIPKLPDTQDINIKWTDMRNYIKDAFGDDHERIAPEEVDTGFIAAHIPDLIQSKCDQPEDLAELLTKLLPHLNNVYLARLVLGSLMVMWTFLTPEPMCSTIYSDKEMKLYQVKISSGM